MPKFNPFCPSGIIAPGMFAGRIDEIRMIEHGLFQAKNGNPQHFLILGERGIGKSSLFYVVDITASGTIQTLENTNMSFLTVSVDLGGAQTQLDIIRILGRGLKQALAEYRDVRERTKVFLDWLMNWEILGVRYHKLAEEIDPQDAADELVIRLSAFCRDTEGRMDGVLILIDEADRPDQTANLGEFCKYFTERLTKRRCNNVVLGLAGLPTLIGKLRGSHESSPRIFSIMLLEPLTPDERHQVIESGLDEANRVNNHKTEITKEAAHLISELSEGYPHFLQQFSYSAFEEDADDVIDANDVKLGAFKENGALAQLGTKYFSEMYHARILSTDYRRVLDAMAQFGDKWVSRKEIIEKSGVSETNVTNALASLKGKQIIYQDETRRGFYRLPTKSFATWINAIRATKSDTDSTGDLF